MMIRDARYDGGPQLSVLTPKPTTLTTVAAGKMILRFCSLSVLKSFGLSLATTLTTLLSPIQHHSSR